MHWSAIENAWLAGLYEGEGTCGAYQDRHRVRLTVCIAMTDEDIVQRVVSITGLGKVISREPYSGQVKPVHIWRLTNKDDIDVFLAAIWVHLGERRKAQIFKSVADTLINIQQRIDKKHRNPSISGPNTKPWVPVHLRKMWDNEVAPLSPVGD